MPARIAVMGLAIPEPAIFKEQGSRLCTGSKIQAKKRWKKFHRFFACILPENYSSICRPRKAAAAEINLMSASVADVVESSFKNITAPQTSPADKIGKAVSANRSEPSTGCSLFPLGAVRVKLCLASISSSKEGDTRRSNNSFFGRPETATT